MSQEKGPLWRGTLMAKMGEATSPPSELNHKPKLWMSLWLLYTTFGKG